MINGLIIDRVLQATGFNKDNEAIFRLTQIQNPSLTSSADQVDALDNTGVKIMSFDRNAAATFSAENAIKDMGLMAAQLGTDRVVASTDKKVEVPAFEIVEGATEYTLAHTPIKTPAVYVLNLDGSLGTKLVAGTAADGGFAYADGKVTVADGIKNEQLVVMYDYEADGTDKNKAVAIENRANVFAKPFRMVVEVLAVDPCDKEELIYMYLIFPSAKLSRNFDLTLDTESAHSFEIECMVDYCSRDKKLFSVVIPE